jgi:cytoskeletal protein CcmA (bactofilin family)
VKERVELRATCTLKGDVKAAKLNVVEGATFVGRCEVGAVAGGAESTPAAAHGHAPAEALRPSVAVAARR